MKIGYFPGCSLHATAREFDESLKAIATALEVELEEVKDWACCGASSAHAASHLLSVALPARTLALAEAQGLEQVLAPCAACYSRLAMAGHAIAEDDALRARVSKVIDRPLERSVAVVSIIEWLKQLAPEIERKRTTPLGDLKVACYYGCLLVRPPAVAGSEDPEAPTAMETIVKAAGAKPVAWHMALECCGGGFSLARPKSVVRLGRAILEDARAAGAQALVVGCPMCHSNLDFRQRAILRRAEAPFELPILFLSELVGMALGLAPRALGMHRHFVSTQPVLDLATAPNSLPEKPKSLPDKREQV
jgi:heterodisulfide reductase subunit B